MSATQNKSITIPDVGVVTIPERNTEEEVRSIVNAIIDEVELLHELFVIEPISSVDPEIHWCDHVDCLEVTEPFASEEDLWSHICFEHND
jgi:hypothetical protein